MSYHIEGKDIVINGFEQGTASSPYAGIADIRNMDIITVPGEASVEFSEVPALAPPVLNGVAYTASAAAATLTWANTATLYQGVAIVLSGNTATGLSNGVVYYVKNIVGATFQLALQPGFGTVINITGNGTGTFTTYQYGDQRGLGEANCVPISYYVDKHGTPIGQKAIYIVDGSNYVWCVLPNVFDAILPANALIFLGNIGGVGASPICGAGIAVWNDYLMLFGTTTAGVDYAHISTLFSSGPAAAWSYTWKTVTTQTLNSRVSMVNSQGDGNLYFTSADGVGSLIKTPGTNFDPTNSATYTLLEAALLLPSDDVSTCISELGPNLLIGGQGNFVYVWNRNSLGFDSLLNIPDPGITAIVSVSQNAYVFAGTRGRIYITNGSGIDLYKKFSDYVTGIVAPYIVWYDANFGRNQLYFGFASYDNTNTQIANTSGAWAIDLDTDTLRMQNKTTQTGYPGSVSMVTEMPQVSTTQSAAGTAMVIGWSTIIGGSPFTYGVDVGSSIPYSNYESYVELDMIPVGTFLDPFSPSQVEWKTSVPLVAGESIRLSYRPSLETSFSLITDPTHTTGESSGVGAIADVFQVNFQKVQWVQLKVETKSTNTNPSYVRLTEIRIRDYPSGNQNERTYPITV